MQSVMHQVLHGLLRQGNEQITIEHIIGLHLSKQRLLYKIQKNAQKQFGESWFFKLCELYNFTFPTTESPASFAVRDGRVFINSFTEAFGIFLNYFFLSDLVTVAPGIGTDLYIGDVKFSTLNSVRSTTLGCLFLWIPLFITNHQFTDLQFTPQPVTYPEKVRQTDELLIVMRTFETFKTKKEVVHNFNDRNKIYSVFHKLSKQNYFHTLDNGVYLKTVNRQHATLLTSLMIDLPFNPSGKGWASPKRQYSILMEHGIHFSPNASYSWCSTLGIDASKANEYSVSFHNYFDSTREGIFANTYIPSGYPIGFLICDINVVSFHCAELSKLRTSQDSLKRSNLVVHSPIPGLLLLCIGKRGVNSQTELILKNGFKSRPRN